MAAASFLALPAELRNEIYGLVFSSLSTPLHNPWDDGRSCTTVMSLFRSCRKVYLEASLLLWRDHTKDVLLHFDSSSEFVNFMQSRLLRWPQLKDPNFRLRVTAPDRRQPSSIEDQMDLVGALLMPIPKDWTDQYRRMWTTSLCRGLDLWRTLHNPRKRLVRDPIAAAAGIKKVWYWISDGFVYMGAGDFEYTLYSWDNWFVLPAQKPGAGIRHLPGGRHVGGDYEVGQDFNPEFGAAGWDVAAGRKIRSDCVVVYGDIGDAVKAWSYDRLRRGLTQPAATRNA